MASFPATSAAWAIATIVATIGVGISVYNIVGHIRNYTAPPLQKDIVRLLFIVPLYGLCSVLSLIFWESSPYIEIIRDIYEAFVIYCFLNLMLTFGGGEHHMAMELQELPRMKHPPPFCCLPKITLNAAFIKAVKRGTLQFVVIKLVFATVSIILLAAGEYNEEAWQVTNLVVYNIAYTIALYALLLFYMATKDIVSTMSPAKKFFAIKTIVFFTYWQELLVGLGPGSAEEANRWNDFILCVEMPLFAILQYRAFPWYEFQSGVPNKSWLAAAGEVMSVRDVAQDLMHNIKPAYQEYTLNSQQTGVTNQQGMYVGQKKKKYKTRTFIIGNLGAQEAKRRKGGGERPEKKESRRVESADMIALSAAGSATMFSLCSRGRYKTKT